MVAEFGIRVNETAEDVVRVARTVGAARATDPETLRNLFCAKLEGALGTAIRARDYLASFASLDELRDRVLELVGHDLNGYVLDDLAFTHFEHTPVSELDEGNILDARGIEKITTLASAARVSAAEAKRVALRRLLELETESEALAEEIAKRTGERPDLTSI